MKEPEAGSDRFINVLVRKYVDNLTEPRQAPHISGDSLLELLARCLEHLHLTGRFPAICLFCQLQKGARAQCCKQHGSNNRRSAPSAFPICSSAPLLQTGKEISRPRREAEQARTTRAVETETADESGRSHGVMRTRLSRAVQIMKKK